MIEKIDHIGIAVKDLDAAVKEYKDKFGIEPSMTETLEAQKIRVAKLPVGEVKIELIEPLAPDGPIGKYIEKKGEGIHHIAYRVDDIDAELARLREQGANLIDKEARVGAGGMRIAFIHPKDMNGVLTELVEKPE